MDEMSQRVVELVVPKNALPLARPLGDVVEHHGLWLPRDGVIDANYAHWHDQHVRSVRIGTVGQLETWLNHAPVWGPVLAAALYLSEVAAGRWNWLGLSEVVHIASVFVDIEAETEARGAAQDASSSALRRALGLAGVSAGAWVGPALSQQ